MDGEQPRGSHLSGMDPAVEQRAREAAPRVILDAYGVSEENIEAIRRQGYRSTVEMAEAQERRERAFAEAQLGAWRRQIERPDPSMTSYDSSGLRVRRGRKTSPASWPGDARAPWLPELLALLLVMGAIVLVVVALAAR